MARFLGNFESGSDQWNELRNGAVTGTLFGTICGLNPWESAYTAWAKATGKISDEVKQSRPMRLGQLLEPVVKQIWMEENPGFIIVDGIGTWAHDDYDWARANPDGVLRYPDDTEGICEVKTSRVPFDEVPPHYEAQMLWYMWVMGLSKGKLIALFSGNDLQTFDVVFDQFKFDALFAAVLRWRDAVESDSKPDWDGSQSTYETVKKLNTGMDSSEIDLGDLGVHLSNAQSDLDKATEKLTMLKSITLDNMADAKYGYVEALGEKVNVAVRSVNKNGVVSLTIKKGKNV
jgi:putative phage-type endonuclease